MVRQIELTDCNYALALETKFELNSELVNSGRLNQEGSLTISYWTERQDASRSHLSILSYSESCRLITKRNANGASMVGHPTPHDLVGPSKLI